MRKVGGVKSNAVSFHCLRQPLEIRAVIWI